MATGLLVAVGVAAVLASGGAVAMDPPAESASWAAMVALAGVGGAVLGALGLAVVGAGERDARLTWLVAALAVVASVLLLRLSATPALSGHGGPFHISFKGVSGLTLVWRAAVPIFVVGATAGWSHRALAWFSAGAALVCTVVLLVDERLPTLLSDSGPGSASRNAVALALGALWSYAALRWIRIIGDRPFAHEGWVALLLSVGAVNQLTWISADLRADVRWDSAGLTAPLFLLTGAGLGISCAVFAVQLRRYERDVSAALSAAQHEIAQLRAPAQQQVIALTPGLEASIRRVLDGERHSMVYQPIVDLATGDIAGVEALSRFDLEPAQPPDKWFAAARHVGLAVDLELFAVSKALEETADLRGRDLYLSVNLSPATIASPEFDRRVRAYHLDGVVVEITEHDAIGDYDLLHQALRTQTPRGLRLAIDDVGSGHGGLRHLVGLHPDIIKIDRSLVAAAPHDSTTATLLEALSGFATGIGAVLVAEGLETASELRIVTDVGIHYGQGYLLARPSSLTQFRSLLGTRLLDP